MLKPIFALVLIVAAVACSLATVDRVMIHSAASGHPLDWCGDLLRCQECGGVVKWDRSYDYTCRQCNHKSRWQLVDGAIEITDR